MAFRKTLLSLMALGLVVSHDLAAGRQSEAAPGGEIAPTDTAAIARASARWASFLDPVRYTVEMSTWKLDAESIRSLTPEAADLLVKARADGDFSPDLRSHLWGMIEKLDREPGQAGTNDGHFVGAFHVECCADVAIQRTLAGPPHERQVWLQTHDLSLGYNPSGPQLSILDAGGGPKLLSPRDLFNSVLSLRECPGASLRVEQARDPAMLRVWNHERAATRIEFERTLGTPSAVVCLDAVGRVSYLELFEFSHGSRPDDGLTPSRLLRVTWGGEKDPHLFMAFAFSDQSHEVSPGESQLVIAKGTNAFDQRKGRDIYLGSDPSHWPENVRPLVRFAEATGR